MKAFTHSQGHSHQLWLWRPDRPDSRDRRFLELAPRAQAAPPACDLRPLCSPIENQGKIGSCTANALAGAIEFLERRELRDGEGPQVFPGGHFLKASRLFLYYNERQIAGTSSSDSGATLRDGIKSLVKWGVCAEALWSYEKSHVLMTPPAEAYAQALPHRISSYYRLETLSEMKACLASGFPFVLGFVVFESFESKDMAQTGVMSLPSAFERVLGGHAVMAVGYDDASSSLLIRNSWGKEWGQQGYFRMPYAFAENPRWATDFWTVRR